MHGCRDVPLHLPSYLCSQGGVSGTFSSSRLHGMAGCKIERTMSTHSIPVIRVPKIEPHPNADRLSLVRIYGYTVCIRNDDFSEGDLAVYIEPDYLVDSSRPEFTFLKGQERIKVRRFRGVLSQGLLIRAPEGAKEGDEMMEALGLRRYEPPLPLSTMGESVAGPDGFFPVYDVESWRRYRDLLNLDEEIVVTEKIHGASGRYLFRGGQMHVSGRSDWKKEDETVIYWRAVKQQPWIETFCRAHPELVLYGEVFGRVQDLRYGAGRNDIFFRAFDLLEDRNWLPYDRMAALLTPDQRVPQVYRGPYSPEKLEELADGPSLIPLADHLREGIVVRPLEERREPRLGRVILKVVSNTYLERG